MYLRPSELRDMTFDFVAFSKNNFTVTLGLNPSDRAIQYFTMGTGQTFNNPPQLISQNGSNGADYSIKKLDNNPRAYVFKRPLNGPGFYNENIKYFSKIVNYSPLDPKYFEDRPYLVQNDTFNYLVFQKAVVSLSIDSQPISNGKLVIADINTPIIVDGSASRGYEQSFELSIFVRDSSLNWVEAVSEVDYASIPNDGAVNSYTLTFLRLAEFKIVAKVTGYDSNAHPFGYASDSRDLIAENVDIVSFKLNTGVQANIDSITLPTIMPIIQGEEDEDGGYNLLYSNKEFTISPDVQYETGAWTVNSQQIFPSNATWLELLQDNSIIKLHVQDATNTDVIPPKDGLGPHKVILPYNANFKFKYITTLR